MTFPLKTSERFPGDLGRRTAVAGVFLITVFAACIRVYKFPTLSITYDEYITGAAFLGASSLRKYLDLVLMTVAEQPTAYHAIQYAWYCFWGPSISGMRLLPLLINIPAIPMAYLFSARIFGRRAGLLAALFLALSPMAIFWSQGFRLFAFSIPLGLLSMYTCLRACKHGSPSRGGFSKTAPRWMLANIAVNALLISLQVTAILLVGVEVLVVLFSQILRRRVTAPFLAWNAVNACAAAAAALLFLAKPRITGSGVGAPGILEGLRWLLASDCMNLCTDIPQPEHVSGFFDPGSFTGFVILLAMIGTLVWLVLRLAMTLHKQQGSSQEDRATAGLLPVLLLILVWAVPTIVLFLANVWLIRRIHFFPRYTMYALPAIHAALAGSLCAIPWRLPRRAAMAIIIAAYAGQIPYVLPTLLRADWIGVANHIRLNSKDPSLVIVTGEPFSAEVFECNARWTNISIDAPIAAALTPEAALDATLCYLAQDAPSANSQTREVWLLVAARETTSYPAMEHALSDLGLTFERTAFVSGDIILAYRISLPAAPVATDNAMPYARRPWEYDGIVDVEKWLAQAGIDTATPEGAKARALLERLGFHMFSDAADTAVSSWNAGAVGNSTLAQALADLAVAQSPKFVYANLAKAFALKNDRRDRESLQALEAAFKANRSLANSLRPIIEQFWQGIDYPEAVEKLVELRRLGLTHIALPLAGIARKIHKEIPRPIHCGVYAMRPTDMYRLVQCLAKPDDTKNNGLNIKARERVSLINGLWFQEDEGAQDKMSRR